MKRKNKVWLLSAAAILLLLLFLNTRGEKTYEIEAEALHYNGGYQEWDYYVIDEKNKAGVICYTDKMEVPAGVYNVRVHYQQQSAKNVVGVTENGRETFADLPADQEFFEFSVAVDRAADDFQVKLYYGDVGKFIIKGVDLVIMNPAKNNQFFMVLLLVAGAGLFCVFKYTPFPSMSAREKLSLISILGAVVLVSLPLATPGIPFGHDLYWHVGRMEGIIGALSEGQFPARIDMGSNHGYGLLMVLYPDTFLYLPALLQLCGVSMVTAYKSFIVLIHAASALSAFWAASSICRQNGAERERWIWAGSLAAVIYCLFPYRLINLSVRAALGEMLAMVFFPLLLAGVYHVAYGDKRKWYFLVLGATGILHSHIISVLLGGLFTALMLLILCRELAREKRFFSLVKAGAMTLLLNISYLIPLLFYYTGDYTQVNSLKEEVSQSWMHLSDAFIGGFEKMTAVLKTPVFGITTLLCAGLLIAGFSLYQKEKDRVYDYTMAMAIIGFFSFLSATSVMPLGQLSHFPPIKNLLSTIQFPYRFAAVTACIIAVAAGCMCASCAVLYGSRKFWAPALLTALAIFILPVLQSGNEGHFKEIRDTRGGVYNVARSFNDYWPMGAQKDDIDLNDHEVYSSNNSIAVSDYHYGHEGVTMTYTSDGRADFADLPMFYYPCYEARLSDGTALPTSKGENGRLRLSLPPTAEPLQVTVRYKEPVLFRAASLVSLATLAGAVVCWVRRRRKIAAASTSKT